MNAVGYKKRLPISDTESLMDIEVPTAGVGGHDRRSFLIAVGRPRRWPPHMFSARARPFLGRAPCCCEPAGRMRERGSH